MLKTTIMNIGLRKVARACGVRPSTVEYWCKKGRLPEREAFADNRARYERIIAKLEGIPVAEFRKKVKEGAK